MILGVVLSILFAVSWSVVVVAESPSVAPASAPPSVMSLRVRTALRGGLTASGASLLADSTTADLARIADATTGACDADCEKRMARMAEPGRLLLARLAVVGDRYALRVTSGGQESSAIGLLVGLESAATVAAYVIARPETSLLVEGVGRGSLVFVDGVPVAPNVKGVIPVAPGRRVVRVGDGQGPGAMRMVDALPGQVITVSFPPGTDGAPRKPVATSIQGTSRAAPKAATKSQPVARNDGTARPVTRKPLFWGAVGVGVLGVVAGGAVAASSASGGRGPTNDGTTTITFGGT